MTKKIIYTKSIPAGLTVLILMVLSLSADPVRAAEGQTVLEDISKGNKAFVQDASTVRKYSERRKELTKGQKPKAIILTCSDSRVSPEIIFNKGLGDVFIVRTAGNIVGEIGLGSIEYGAEHLECPLLIVMGHDSCGAVKATVASAKAKTVPEGSIGDIVKKIMPVVKSIQRDDLSENEYLDQCIDVNTKAAIRDILSRSKILRELVEERKLMIVGMRYELASGKAVIILNGEESGKTAEQGHGGAK